MKTRIKQIYITLTTGLLLAATVIAMLVMALAGCSREDLAPASDDSGQGDPQNLVQVTLNARLEQPQTRAGFTPNFGVNDETGDVDWTKGEQFHWDTGDKINVYIYNESTQKQHCFTFTVSAVDTENPSYATFTGSIPAELCGEKKRIIANQAINSLGGLGGIVKDDFANLPIQSEESGVWTTGTVDLSAGNPVADVLNFRHSKAMLRFRIKNTDANETYKVLFVQVKEEGSNKQLAQSFNMALSTSEIARRYIAPIITQAVNSELAPANAADNYTLIASETPRTAEGDKLVLLIVAQDKDGKYLNRQITLDRTSPLLQSGFEAGKRYYFNLAINANNLQAGSDDAKIALDAPGSLFIVPGTKKVTISGKLDYDDFATIAAAASTGLQEVDLSQIVYKDDEWLGSISFSPFTTVVFPKYLTSIPKFRSGKLTGSLAIPEGVETISAQIFSECALLTGTLTLPSTVKLIELNAFYNTRFSSMKLNEGLTTIESAGLAIYGCETVTIPSTVTTMEGAAFGKFTNKIKILRTTDMIPFQQVFIFDNNRGPFWDGATIYVPSALLNTYVNAPGWSSKGYTFIGYDTTNPAPF